jgi:outer membrane protein assembly factor BamE (lipoprotein component of BamABCDE complex)
MAEKRGVTRGLTLAYVLVAGCASIGNADLARDEIMSGIHVGETTRQQVMTLLGEPDSRITIDVAGFTREWWSYTYESAVINPIDYLLLYGFFFNGIGLYDTRYDVGVFFDQRGIVSTLSKTKTDFDMGRPFTSLQVSSVSHKTTGSGLPDKAVHFEDRMEYRY